MDAQQKWRKIIHVDMDAFYASVEQFDNPSLRGKAIAVGGGENRGVVAAASYEARKYGVRSAMSGIIARRNCPELIFVKPRFDRYKEVSAQISTYFPNKVYKTIVPRNVRVAEAPSYGKSVIQFDKTSKGAKAYLKLADEVINIEERKNG